VGQALISDLLIPELKFIDLKAKKIEKIDVLFIFGVGDEILHRSLATWLKKEEGRFLIFIEEREEFFLNAKNFSLAKDPKVQIFYWQRGDEEIFQRIAWEFVFLRFGYALSELPFRQAAQEFFIQLEHYHRGVDLLASDSEDIGLKVLTNAMKNLAALPGSRLGSTLEGKCTGIPAIVCGAGPSLDQVAPLLAGMKEKALIIAGGSSVRALSAHGINPHIFANIDPHPPYRRFLEQDCFEVPFFYQGRFCHSLLERVQGPLLWMPDSGSYPLETWLAAEVGVFAERFDGGWTVANFCTALAAHLGCNPIVFVGMDFSCGPNAIYASKIAGDENRDALIELVEDQLYSKRDWLMSAEWTASFAKKNDAIQWINASLGGIDLPGIQRREFSELIEAMPGQIDMPGILHSLVAGASFSQVTSEKVGDVRKRVKESFEKCLEICEGMLRVWEKHYPNSPLEKGEYVILDVDLEQEICHRHFLLPLWNVWKRPILRSSFHPLGGHIHRLLFFKKAIEMHLPHLRSFS
jgi:hypothetical protein